MRSQTELSYVSNTVTNHVQAAEMHNQAVNSLALISARYTFTAIQLVQMVRTVFFPLSPIHINSVPVRYIPTTYTHCVKQ